MAGTAKWDKLQKDMLNALGEAAKKHGVVLEPYGYRYDDNESTFKILATVTDASGAKKDIPRETFIKQAKASEGKPWASIELSWLDKSFVGRGRTYTIVGYKPQRKYSIKTLRDDGGVYFWPASLVAEKMKQAA